MLRIAFARGRHGELILPAMREDGPSKNGSAKIKGATIKFI
jgi:hypothetical protein